MQFRMSVVSLLITALVVPCAWAKIPQDPVSLEAGHILDCQTKSGSAAGAINDATPVNGPSWIVPRENGTAILGLVEAYNATKNEKFKTGALAAAGYLQKRQESDGAWCEYYDETNHSIVGKNKSVSHAGSALMALYRVRQAGWEDPSRRYYDSARRAAGYIIASIDNKPGAKNGLAGAGKEYGNYALKDGFGSYQWSGWSWVSDNCYAYIALTCMEEWASANGDKEFADNCARHAAGVLDGINTHLKNPHTAVWYRVVGENGEPVSESDKIDALCYYPQKMDIPVPQRGSAAIAQWIADNLQCISGSVSSGNGAFLWGSAFGAQAQRRSQGFSLEAYLALMDIPGDTAQAARQKAKAWWEADDDTGGHGQLWDTAGGGIVDWYGPDGSVAPGWQKFIDTSSNCIFVYRGGFNHLLKDAAAPVTTPDNTAVTTSGTTDKAQSLVVYPNPYQPGSTGPLGGSGIVFDHLPSDAAIKVFSLAGDLILDVSVPGSSDKYLWDARNASGQELASGIYVYRVSGNGGEKTGKLAILR